MMNLSDLGSLLSATQMAHPLYSLPPDAVFTLTETGHGEFSLCLDILSAQYTRFVEFKTPLYDSTPNDPIIDTYVQQLVQHAHATIGNCAHLNLRPSPCFASLPCPDCGELVPTRTTVGQSFLTIIRRGYTQT